MHATNLPPPARTTNPLPCRAPECDKHAKGHRLCQLHLRWCHALGLPPESTEGAAIVEGWAARERARVEGAPALQIVPGEPPVRTLHTRIAHALGVSPDGSDDELVAAVQRLRDSAELLDALVQRTHRALTEAGEREGGDPPDRVRVLMARDVALRNELRNALGLSAADGPPLRLVALVTQAAQTLRDLRDRIDPQTAANLCDVLGQAWGDPSAPPPPDPFARLAELVNRTRRDLPALRQRVEDLADCATVVINRPTPMSEEELERRHALLQRSKALRAIALAGGFSGEVAGE